VERKDDRVSEYITYLEQQERSTVTRRQYERDIRIFLGRIKGESITKEEVLRYKEELQEKYRPASVNAKLAALNGFFSYIGRNDLRLRQLRIQKQVYCRTERELTKTEYLHLVDTARRQGNERLSLLLETICGTGIRVSELRFITADAVWRGEAVIRLKGKTRMILIGGKLSKKLKQYMRKRKILSGSIFVTRTGKPMDRFYIWKLMKALCRSAGVEPQKVFPHNLRHLFARCFYAAEKDLAKLADVLGHSNINTTRIYIVSTGREHRRCMEALGLVT